MHSMIIFALCRQANAAGPAGVRTHALAVVAAGIPAYAPVAVGYSVHTIGQTTGIVIVELSTYIVSVAAP